MFIIVALVADLWIWGFCTPSVPLKAYIVATAAGFCLDVLLYSRGFYDKPDSPGNSSNQIDSARPT